MAISGVRSVPKNTNSATTLKNSPVQFVHAYAILSTASYAVRHILKTIPKVSERPPVRARFHPENSATGEDRRALGRIGNIQNCGKASPKNSSTGGHALITENKTDFHKTSKKFCIKFCQKPLLIFSIHKGVSQIKVGQLYQDTPSQMQSPVESWVRIADRWGSYAQVFDDYDEGVEQTLSVLR
jgi:hypothetical protein